MLVHILERLLWNAIEIQNMDTEAKIIKRKEEVSFENLDKA